MVLQANKHFKQVPFGQGRQKLRFFRPLSERYRAILLTLDNLVGLAII